ncbi:hypothetical protein LINPERPRIM_LOCUS31597, partial [Linum perenne]
ISLTSRTKLSNVARVDPWEYDSENSQIYLVLGPKNLVIRYHHITRHTGYRRGAVIESLVDGIERLYVTTGRSHLTPHY